MTITQLVVASNNAKKLAELRSLFAALPLQLMPQAELGITEAAEPFHTFLENALTKARAASRASGLPALADDSGLCVDALHGAPGVVSAHYAPLPEGSAPALDRESLRRQQDTANNALLLQRLQGVANRRAAFVSVLVALRHADDPEPVVSSGRWHGQVLLAPRGQGGFGYDPVLFIPAFNCSAAELDADTKNRVSHRALSAAQMLPLLREAWAL